MAAKQDRYEAPDMLKFIQRIAKGMVRRAYNGDLEALSALAEAVQSMHDAQDLAGAALHDGPFHYSWTEIGRELGIARTSAQERFGGRDLPDWVDPSLVKPAPQLLDVLNEYMASIGRPNPTTA